MTEVQVDVIGHQARSKEGRGISVRSGDSDKWIIIQKTTFTNWINVQLQPRGLEVKDLQDDFCDGVKLCALVECLQQKKIGRVVQKPHNQHQALQNVTVALTAIANDNVRLVNIGSEDIVNGNQKLILGLIWHLILRYQIGKTKFPPKKLMLAWLKAVIPDCNISNFTSDWNDGVALHALLEYCKPGLCPDWKKLSRNNRLDNCSRAMTLAKNEFNIPMIVRPEDFSSPHLDDLSGMTYLSYYMTVDSPGYHATLRNVRALLKHGTINNFTTDWHDGILLCNLTKSLGVEPGGWPNMTSNNVENLQRGMDSARKLGIEPILSAKEMSDPDVEHLGIMAYAAYFTRLTPRRVVADKATINGDFQNIHVGQEKTFQVSVDSDVLPHDVRAEVIGPDSIPPVRMNWSGKTATCSFTPSETGMHKLNVYVEGEAVSGCPVSFQVSSDRSQVYCHQVEKCPIGQTTEMKVDTSRAGKGNVRIEARSPSGHLQSLTVTDRGGVHSGSFNPTEVGDWQMSVRYDDVDVGGSPYTVKVYDPNAVKVYGLEGGAVGKALAFNADTSQAGDGDLDVTVNYQGQNIPCYTTLESNGLHKINFTPQGAGAYKVNVRFAGEEVRGSPYTLEIVDSSMVTVTGDGLSLVPVNRPAVFNVQTRGAGGGNINVDVISPSGRKLSTKIIRETDEYYRIEYFPEEAGDHKITVFFYDQPLRGSPFTCKVYDLGKLIVRNMPKRVLPGNLVLFDIDASLAGSGNIEIRVNEGRVACSVENKGGHQFVASFIPEAPIEHYVEMTFNNTPVEGSPWRLSVLDPQQISAVGHGLELIPINHKAKFKIYSEGTPLDDVIVTVKAPSGQTLPSNISRSSEEIKVDYTPNEVGDYEIRVTCGENEVNGSPFLAKAYDTSAITVTPPADGYVYKPIDFYLDVQYAGEGQLQIMVNNGNLPNEVEVQEDGVYKITFVPVEPGKQTIDISFNEEHLPCSPLTCNASDLSSAIVSMKPTEIVNQQAVFDIKTETDNANQVYCTVEVYSPNGDQVPARLAPQPNGDFKVEWTPNVAGRHTVDVSFAGQQIQGSPFYIEVFDITKVRVDNFFNGNVHEPAGFTVDGSRAGKAEQHIQITSPSGRSVPFDIQENRTGEHKVTYRPNEGGKHRLQIAYGGLDVNGSPFTQEIGEGALPSAHGDGLYRGEEDKTAGFTIDSRGFNGEPTVQVDGPNSMAKVSLERQHDGNYYVSYMPVEVGTYDVFIKWNGRDIHGSPFHPKIVDARKVRVVGGWQHYMDPQERVQLTVGEEKRIPFDTSDAGPGQLTAEVKGPSGHVHATIDDAAIGRSVVCFTPREEGNHYIHLYWSEHPLSNSPFLGYATGGSLDPSKVILTGRGLKEAIIREEAEFLIDGSQAGLGNPEVQLIGVRAEVNVIVTPLGGGKFRCTYIPVIPGGYLLHISWNNRQLKGSPYKVNITGAFYPNRVEVSGEGLKGGMMGDDIDVRIDTRKAGPGELTAYCMGPTNVAFCELQDNHDGRYNLRIKPQETGRHVLQIKYGGEHVLGSPYAFRISAQPDASKVRVSGPGVEHGILATFQSRFIVETRGAGQGQLTVRIRGPKGAFQVEMYRDSQKDRTILCRYDPAETGLYVISIRWSGVDVPGSPFHVHIVDTQHDLEHVLQEAAYSTNSMLSRHSGNYSQWRDDI